MHTLDTLLAEDEFLLDMDLDLWCFFGLGRLTGALGGSIRVSSMTKTTPSSVSELLFFVVFSLLLSGLLLVFSTTVFSALVVVVVTLSSLLQIHLKYN